MKGIGLDSFVELRDNSQQHVSLYHGTTQDGFFKSNLTISNYFCMQQVPEKDDVIVNFCRIASNPDNSRGSVQ